MRHELLGLSEPARDYLAHVVVGQGRVFVGVASHHAAAQAPACTLGVFHIGAQHAAVRACALHHANIDTGFRRAMATIVDANATHLIASLILFELGSGPVRGFAVTLGVGIITSFFTAVMVTRLIVIGWLHVAKPKKLTI